MMLIALAKLVMLMMMMMMMVVSINLVILVMLPTLTRQIWQILMRILVMNIKIPVVLVIPMSDDVAVADDAALMVVMDDDGGAHDADDGSQSYSTRLHVKLTTPMLKTTRWQF